MVLSVIFGLVVLFIIIGGFCVFFDQAVFSRRGTIYRVKTDRPCVLLTFDDGPSPEWTPRILEELKKENIKAAFFMIGHHVKKYPDIARQVAAEGHTIGNHGFAHSVMFYYTMAEIEEEIKYTEHVIKEITGQTTKYFRPPKAWMNKNIKEKIKDMGYKTVLWSLNSKDWVSFNHKSMVNYISRHVRNGDILLFHDSGNVSSTEGGTRRQTVKSISLLARTLREKGFEFVSIEELINGD
ncbi:MAG: polysaccharide deacetylase family protein [Candidatus Omnitrophica bacterium]|nr:polysaccharide deacetylase family protein [Candidatus Omnitrophota bacterium]